MTAIAVMNCKRTDKALLYCGRRLGLELPEQLLILQMNESNLASTELSIALLYLYKFIERNSNYKFKTGRWLIFWQTILPFGIIISVLSSLSSNRCFSFHSSTACNYDGRPLINIQQFVCPTINGNHISYSIQIIVSSCPSQTCFIKLREKNLNSTFC